MTLTPVRPPTLHGVVRGGPDHIHRVTIILRAQARSRTVTHPL